MLASMGRVACLIVYVLLFSIGNTVDADTLRSRSPADVAISWWSQPNETERARRARLWQAVRGWVADGGLVELRQLIERDWTVAERAAVAQMGSALQGLVAKVNWAALAQAETLVTVRLATALPELGAVFQSSESDSTARFTELSQLFQEIASTASGFLVAEETTTPFRSVRLGVVGSPLELRVTLAGELLSITTSKVLSLELFQQQAESLVTTESYRSAALDMPVSVENCDEELYVDIERLVAFGRSLLLLATSNAPEAGAWRELADRLLREANLSPALISRRGTVASKTQRDTQIRFRSNLPPGRVERWLGSASKVSVLLAALPDDAQSFVVSAGVDLARVYDEASALIRWALPHGDLLTEAFGQLEARFAFSFRDDVLSWLDGSTGWMSFGQGAHALVARTTRPELAERFLNSALARAQKFFASRHQTLRIEPSEELGEGYRRVVLEPFSAAQPVIGFEREILVIASSAETALRVRMALSPSTTAPDAKDETTKPASIASLRSWARIDLGALCAEAGAWTSQLGFVLSILPSLDNEGKTRASVGGSLSKLGRALTQLRDLGKYEATTHYETAGRVWRRRCIQD